MSSQQQDRIKTPVSMIGNLSAAAAILAALFMMPQAAPAAVYYVAGGATNSSDANPGTLGAPFKTIGKAAGILIAGDTCYLRGGTYRETIIPARGGTSNTQRIVYLAYPGETPIVKGSEQITNWVNTSGTVWQVSLPDSFFGSWNPYTTNISGPYLNYGTQYHLGEVYLNGTSYNEQLAQSTVASTANSWYASNAGGAATIWANFGSANPNTGLAEINVRECVIAPTAERDYLTFDGITMQHAACNWAANVSKQRGLISIWDGRYWVVQNCHITDAKCAGIASTFLSIGDDRSYACGHHLVKNNVIERCGQAGTVGMYGWMASIIEGNVIQDINAKKQFGGYETAGIKFHNTVDLIIRNNIIRRVRLANGGVSHACGIWEDYANQGIRITGNVIYNIDENTAIMPEEDMGPTLIDNNIICNSAIYESASQNSIFVHNLFYNTSIADYWHDGRTSKWYTPHTMTVLGTVVPTPSAGDRNFNNIFIGSGPANGSSNNYAGDYNVYYQGAAKNSYGDAASIVKSSFAAGFSITDLPSGARISFNADNAPAAVACPLITNAFLGTPSTTTQGIENPDGSAITIATDMFGTSRNPTHPTAGPIENLVVGQNSFTRLAGTGEVATAASPIHPTVGNGGLHSISLSDNGLTVTANQGEQWNLRLFDLDGRKIGELQGTGPKGFSRNQFKTADRAIAAKLRIGNAADVVKLICR